MQLGRKKEIQIQWGVCAAIGVLAFLMFSPSIGFEFVNFDDPEYVINNKMVNVGLTWKGIVWAFTQNYASNWHPLTWISHMIDCQLFGMKPAGHHLTNVLFHSANSMLVFLLFFRMTGRLGRSALVAALFAWHPAHIESVAWISERKDVLSTFFGLFSLIGYVNWTKQKKIGRLWLALGCYALSLLSKGMLVTLPFLLLLLDFWPLQRMENCGAKTFLKPEFRRLIYEKWPWFVLSFAASAATYWAQSTGGAVVQVHGYSIGFRLANAATAYCCYIGEMFWPFDMAVYYPLLPYRLILPLISACVILGSVSIVAFAASKRWPFLLTGWYWFVGTLVPVIGIVQVGSQSMADRYTYVPFLGLFAAVIWLLAELLEKRTDSSKLSRGIAATILIIVGLSTWWQLGYWQDSLTLFARDVQVAGESPVAMNNLGAAYVEKGDEETAILCFRSTVQNMPNDALARGNLAKLLLFNGTPAETLEHSAVALRLEPTNAVFHLIYGDALCKLGQREAALSYFKTAIRYNSNLVQAYSDMGLTLVELGRIDDGITNLQYAIRKDTNFVDAYNNLGTALLKQGKTPQAIQAYEQVLALSPTNAAAHYNLGLIKDKMGDSEGAMQHFQTAVSFGKKHADARFQLGKHLYMRGRLEEATRWLADALQLKPGLAQARIYLGLSLFDQGRENEAVGHIMEARKLLPDSLEVLNAAAWMKSTATNQSVLNSAEAVNLAETAATLTQHNQPVILRTLAASYAQAGRFSDAISTAEQAISQANSKALTNLSASVQQELDVYKSGKPWQHKILRR